MGCQAGGAQTQTLCRAEQCRGAEPRALALNRMALDADQALPLALPWPSGLPRPAPVGAGRPRPAMNRYFQKVCSAPPCRAPPAPPRAPLLPTSQPWFWCCFESKSGESVSAGRGGGLLQAAPAAPRPQTRSLRSDATVQQCPISSEVQVTTAACVPWVAGVRGNVGLYCTEASGCDTGRRGVAGSVAIASAAERASCSAAS